jgi:hypothetical protein
MIVDIQVGQTYEHYSKYHRAYVYFEVTQIKPNMIVYDYSQSYDRPTNLPTKEENLNVSPSIFRRWIIDGSLVLLDDPHTFEIET